MSNLLIDERPLIVLPSLMCRLNGDYTSAIVLQQIHFMCNQPRSGVEHEGHKWVWFTYEEFCQDHTPWLSPHTLRKAIKKLENEQLIVSTQRVKDKWDSTKYYRVNTGQLEPSSNGRPEPTVNGHIGDTVNGQLIYRTETSSKTTPQNGVGGVQEDCSDDVPYTLKEVYRFYESNFSLLTPFLSDAIAHAYDDFPSDWIVEAMQIALTNSRRKWSYVEGILKRWHAEGKQDTRKQEAAQPKMQAVLLEDA